MSHPQFQPGPRFYNDIAVLRLSREVPLSSSVQPLCLPSPGTGGDLTGETAVVLGWGRTREGGPRSQLLRAVDVRVWPEEGCREAYRGIANILPGMICASKPGKDSCAGDSGGPLVLCGPAHCVQVGLASWGVGCAEPGYPGVYTRLDYFTPWILNITARD